MNDRHNSNPNNSFMAGSNAISGMPLVEPKTTSQVRDRPNSQKSTKSPRNEDICTPHKLLEDEKK